jgi:hypothetical protein
MTNCLLSAKPAIAPAAFDVVGVEWRAFWRIHPLI